MEKLKKEILLCLLSLPSFYVVIDRYKGGGAYIFDCNNEENWPFIEGDEETPKEPLLKVSTKKIVCPDCRGEGTELRDGLKGAVFTPEEFERDPEFAANYFGGAYDVPCSRCHGENVIEVPNLEYVRDIEKLKEISRILNNELEEIAIAEMEARGEALWRC